MDVQQLHYAPLLNQLHQRAVRSVVSQLALRSKSLTHYLESQYFQPPGQEGSLLADPVFESTFGWMPADETMEDLRDKLISSPLVDALSKAPVPFRHQLTAWRTILEDKKSLLVSSGTGSGNRMLYGTGSGRSYSSAKIDPPVTNRDTSYFLVSVKCIN